MSQFKSCAQSCAQSLLRNSERNVRSPQTAIWQHNVFNVFILGLGALDNPLPGDSYHLLPHSSWPAVPQLLRVGESQRNHSCRHGTQVGTNLVNHTGCDTSVDQARKLGLAVRAFVIVFNDAPKAPIIVILMATAVVLVVAACNFFIRPRKVRRHS